MPENFYTTMINEWLSCQEQTNTLFWQERTGQIKREETNKTKNVKEKKNGKSRNRTESRAEEPDLFGY